STPNAGPSMREPARLEAEAVQTRRSLMVTGSAPSQDLVAADLYLRHLADQKKRQAAKLTDWQARASKEQKAVVQARRRVRLIEKLEERQFQAWKAAADREQENLASELYLARWKRKTSRPRTRLVTPRPVLFTILCLHLGRP